MSRNRVRPTAAESVIAKRIATLIAQLTAANISRAALLVEIARQFPSVSYRSFLLGMGLFEALGRGGLQ
jgi:hypothetical protein